MQYLTAPAIEQLGPFGGDDIFLQCLARAQQARRQVELGGERRAIAIVQTMRVVVVAVVLLAIAVAFSKRGSIATMEDSSASAKAAA